MEYLLLWCFTIAKFCSVVYGLTLTQICTDEYVAASLPANEVVKGITIERGTPYNVTEVYGYNISKKVFYPDAVIDFCNVTFAYSHNGTGDRVLLNYWLPAPNKFQGRFLATGGGGYRINSFQSSVLSSPGGIIYGAVTGLTDGGFGGFNRNFDNNFPLSDGTANWPATYMFGYQAIYEMTMIGKQFTKNLYNVTDKLYAYYQGCSEGGRDGWSQVQRFADLLDGVITGAPAFRFSHQQTQHLYSNIVEQTMDYYPPPCELDQIANATIKFCDPLDGKTDGVVSRSDLCKLEFDINSVTGQPYHCPATAATSGIGGLPAAPEQIGNVSAMGAAVASKILDGLRDSEGRRAYFSYQYATTFLDAQTQWNASSEAWVLSQSGLGSIWPERFLYLRNSSVLPTLEGVTYDTLRDWMSWGWWMYADTLQTTQPELTPFHQAGGKVLHFHGESDNSIPTASSVRYRESVRQTMYGNLSYNQSNAALDKWYRLFLVPGAGHCTINPYQPNHPFPQTNLAVMIDWVEHEIEPTMLNATYLAGENLGQNAQICSWPLRPFWTNNSTEMSCVYDQRSIDTWHYDLGAFNLPVY